MTGVELLAREIKKYRSICYYPSAGTDLGDIDFFGSGRKRWQERRDGGPAGPGADGDPDLFIHTDINFYQEFAAGADLAPAECGIHGASEVVSFRELPPLEAPNAICDNFVYSGKCFEYRLRVWGVEKTKTLIFCLCENEALVSKVFLAHGIRVPFIWSRNWAGGKTQGTWLANVLDRLGTRKLYTDWLCIPGQRGEPRNGLVGEKYPELMVPARVKLVRNDDIHWIEEGAHGWLEEFDVVPCGVTQPV